MHSWELLKNKNESTLMAIIIRGTVSLTWAVALSDLEKPAMCQVMRVEGLPYGEARTQAANHMLDNGFSYLFFTDSDVLLRPETLTQLMSYQLPVVSGLYHQKFAEWSGSEAVYRPVMLRLNNGKPEHVIDYKPGSLVEVDLVGAGCLLVHRSVFERLKGAGIRRFFEWTLHEDRGDQPGFSEDYTFCLRARQLGIPIYVDTSLVLPHETTAVVTQRGLQAKL